MHLAAAATSDIVFLFAGAGLVLYIAARAAVDAVTNAADPSPGRMALAHWMPIAWTALIATLAGRAEIGLGIAFATSVAAMGLVLGVLICVSPNLESAGNDSTGANAASGGVRTTAWPFVVPAALLALLAGFSGSLTWGHAVMLLVVGLCVAWVWRGRDEPAPPGTIALPIPPPPPPPLAQRRYWLGQLLLSIALGGIGGWLAYKATLTADNQSRAATGGLIALAIVSPLLALPMLGTGAIAAHHGKLNAALGTIVGVILLNLCLLVPLVILSHYVKEFTDFRAAEAHAAFIASTQPTSTASATSPAGSPKPAAATNPSSTRPSPATAPAAASVATPQTDEEAWESLRAALKPLPYPLAVWRVDTVLLIVLGLLLIPVSLGRWRLTRLEGLGLTFVYAAYLIVSTILAVRL